MQLIPEQAAQLVAALKAESNQDVVNALAKGNDVYLQQWCNQASDIDAWSTLDSRSALEATDVAAFIALEPGNRDAWRMFLDFAPIDFNRSSNREKVAIIWPDPAVILQACTRKATNAERYLGGKPTETAGVAALELAWSGTLALDELGRALNKNGGRA